MQDYAADLKTLGGEPVKLRPLAALQHQWTKYNLQLSI